MQGSPFEWKVEKWTLTVQPWTTRKSFLNLVSDNMRVQYIQNFDVWSLGIPSVLTALGSVGFSEGKHLWKVRMLEDGNSVEAGIGIGVASSTEERPLHAAVPQSIQHEWLWTRRPLDHLRVPLCKNFTTLRFPTCAGSNDVIELYLDCDNGRLTMYHPDTNQSSTTMLGVRGRRLYPVFLLCSNGNEVSLRSTEIMTVTASSYNK